MSKKEFVLIGFIGVLIGLYAVFFTDWFRPKTIRIEHSARPSLTASRSRQAGANVTFSLRQNYKLTSIKVVALAEYLTNRYARPLWELTSESGSQPIDGFAYGMPVEGMAPVQIDLEPEPLAPGVEYRLIVEAGAARGEHDFKAGGNPGVRH